jgi:hypothetical protein
MNPPRLATWLLHRWGSGPQRESLVGDLVERYQQGRSPAWYWRQVLRGIIVGMLYEMGDHKWLAIRALAVGWIVVTLTDRARWDILYVALKVPIGTPLEVAPWFGLYFNLTLLGSAGLSGWIVARFHRPYAISMAAIFATSFSLFIVTVTIEAAIQGAASAPPHWVISYVAKELFAGLFMIPMSMMLGGLLGAGRVRRSRVSPAGGIA